MIARQPNITNRAHASCGFAWSSVCSTIIILAACATTHDQPNSNLAAVSEPTATRALLHGGEHGLEVRQWLITENVDLIASVMSKRAEANVLTAAERDRLRRNGLRLVRVPLDSLDELEAELGGSFLHNVGWHGQPLDWQELLSRILPQQRAVAVDGRVRLLEGGRLRLMNRAWIVQMEEGRRLNVQIVPQHFRPAPMSYYRLLGRDMGEGAPIASMAMDMLLEDGYAYLLTCESPMVDWQCADGECDEQTPVRGAAGPDAPGATTIGQLLLRTEQSVNAPPGRAILILVPRLHSSPESNLDGFARTLRTGKGASGR